jgi:hypothetical protein
MGYGHHHTRLTFSHCAKNAWNLFFWKSWINIKPPVWPPHQNTHKQKKAPPPPPKKKQNRSVYSEVCNQNNKTVTKCSMLRQQKKQHKTTGDTRWRSWLRHCATSREVTGLIPDGVIGIFHWHNPSGCTMALGLTQPLREILPGVFPGG